MYMQYVHRDYDTCSLGSVLQAALQPPWSTHLGFEFAGVGPEDAGQPSVALLVIAGRQIQRCRQVQPIFPLVPALSHKEGVLF